MNKNIEYFNKCIQSLHTNVQKGSPAPHKAILLLSIIDLIEDGDITDARIFLTEELEARFLKLWKYYLGKSLLFSPDIFKPYYHMDHEPFWNLVSTEENRQEKVEPRYNRSWIQSNYQYALIDEELFKLLKDERVRAQFRLSLIGKYLVGQPIEQCIPAPILAKKSSVIGKLCSILSLFVA